jgi:hypothetical protein
VPSLIYSLKGVCRMATSWSSHGGPPHWRPPFPGPPPMPQGMSMNPQHWAAGQWQFNPSFNSRRFNPSVQGPHQSASQWAPGYGWGGTQPGMGVPQHNPYKRVPRQPDPSYWETELSDNPLGLIDMVPRCVLLINIVVLTSFERSLITQAGKTPKQRRRR